MGMFKEFKEFASRGNVIDLAVGVILGASFGKIVSSFVADVFTPVIGLALGDVDLKGKFIDLSGKGHATIEAAKAAGAATLNYGMFLNAAIDFLIVAFVLFLFIRMMNRIHRAKQAVPEMKECPHCRTSIPLRATRCPHCTSQLPS